MTSEFDRFRIFHSLMRQDLSSFIQRAFVTVNPGGPFQQNWHIDAIACQLERVARGEIRRLIVRMPPRSLRSIAASVAFPAWLLGQDPRMRVLAVSYAEGLSEKLALGCLKVLEAPWYKACFPATRISKGRGARSDFEGRWSVPDLGGRHVDRSRRGYHPDR